MTNHHSPVEEKIALFRSVFRGNEELYPRKFLNRRSGEIGFEPACSNEWVAGVCEKPRIKCYDCFHQRFQPMANEVVHWHLSGYDHAGRPFILSIYPILPNETCCILVFECDKMDWKEDASTFLKVCQNLDLPVAAELTSSGARLWLFFEEALPLALVRKLGSYILTEAMENRPEMGLDSYDKFVPHQDTLIKRSFGEVLVLPLQKKARHFGYSVFVDPNFAPYQDQWAFLSQIQKIDRRKTEDIALIQNRKVYSQPKGSFPETVELILSNEICIAKTGLCSGLKNRMIRLAAFQNPQFYKRQAMRHSVNGEARMIGCAHEDEKHIKLPRGCLEDLCELFDELKINVRIQDARQPGNTLDVTFAGELREEQKAAAEAMLVHNTGILSAPTTFGKSVIVAWLIAKRRVNTIVIVHRRPLVEQWKERLSLFLNIPAASIGQGKWSGLLDVVLIQNLARNECVEEQLAPYGYMIVDECHHLPATSFLQVTQFAKAKFTTGLTATLERRDGRHPIIQMQCGPVRYHVTAKEQAASHPFEHTVIVRPTSFQAPLINSSDFRVQFREIYRALITDPERNRCLIEDVLAAVQKGRYPIVLTERNEHLDCLNKLLTPHVEHLFILRGGMKTKELTKNLGAIQDRVPRVILASGRFVGEGFDDARLDTLFLTLPISWHGTIAQYIGRLHRLHASKTEVRVYDYADLNVPMLARMFKRRCQTYEALGYQVLLQGGAVPVWPMDVALPQDASWKNVYGATIRRLLRDGVDEQLAKLFAESSSINSEGVARSATEAFLFRRLQTLPQTEGLFFLNALLPIPFDGLCQMEVDLLCYHARIAIEIDGPQHLANPEAYRRDRRKDRLLQENGYIVLRFLTEDVTKHLDHILDTIVRALSRNKLIEL